MFDTCIALIYVYLCIYIYSRQRIPLFSLRINQYNNNPVLYKKAKTKMQYFIKHSF